MASDNRMVFQDEAIRFLRAGSDHTAPAKTTAATGFGIGGDQNRFVNPSWSLDRSHSDDDEYDDDDDVDDEDDDDDENVNVKNGNTSSSSVHSSSSAKANGLSGGMMEKDGNLSEQQKQQQHERVSSYENAITVVRPEMCCAQIMNGGDASGPVQKEMGGENGCGFGRRKEVGVSIDPGEPLRVHLVDPVSGDLMDDAMILPCGHSFGSGGMQHVFRMKACCKCSRPILEDLVRPNLALRSAVHAFRREEESLSLRAPKRRRDRFEQEKCSYDDPYTMDSRAKGIQFPFVVSDRVIIKGNKRTPQRFVGRVAVVTTQCLNGWYVVKTLDNAESVKLQYRSLAKVSDDSTTPSGVTQPKPVAPNWL